jgi:hypothetical protein
MEEPEYVVAERGAGFEIRRYAARMVAETLVTDRHPKAATAGFRRLANYLLGENQGKRTGSADDIGKPMTMLMGVPYVQVADEAGQRLQFPLPRGLHENSVPQPRDEKVVIRAVRPRRIAVIRYNGVWTEPRFRLHLARLERALLDAGLAWTGAPEWARYDPPWKPWFARRNEIWLELKSSAG